MAIWYLSLANISLAEVSHSSVRPACIVSLYGYPSSSLCWGDSNSSRQTHTAQASSSWAGWIKMLPSYILPNILPS